MNSLNFRLTIDGVDDKTLVVRDYQDMSRSPTRKMHTEFSPWVPLSD
ncbi:hypothetical protein P4S72_10890 [Vibrio sp. PP-XX7]